MFKVIFVLLFLTSCYQKETNIIYKNGGKKQSDTYVPNYLKGSYMNHNNKIVRDLKAKNIGEGETDYKEDDENDGENGASTKEIDKSEKKKFVSYVIVENGDSLLFYSRKYNTTVEEIAKINNLKKPYNIFIGQKLKIMNNSSDIEREEKNKKLKNVVVKLGDNLLKLSIEYNTTLREMAEINNLKAPYDIYVGQKLKVPDSEKSVYIEKNKKNTPNINTEKENHYIVEKGDNLFYIAKKFNISVNDLIRINSLEKPYNVYVGQKLLINSFLKKQNEPSIEKKDEKLIKTNNTKNVEIISETEKNNENNFDWPLKGEITKRFGEQVNGKSFDGILIKTTKGTEIKASDEGEVIYAGNELKDFGNIVIIKHANNWLSIYGHCEKINVKVKNKIKKGEIIAIAGKSGNTKEEQLYFAIRRGRVATDPLKYLSK